MAGLNSYCRFQRARLGRHLTPGSTAAHYPRTVAFSQAKRIARKVNSQGRKRDPAWTASRFTAQRRFPKCKGPGFIFDQSNRGRASELSSRRVWPEPCYPSITLHYGTRNSANNEAGRGNPLFRQGNRQDPGPERIYGTSALGPTGPGEDGIRATHLEARSPLRVSH